VLFIESEEALKAERNMFAETRRRRGEDVKCCLAERRNLLARLVETSVGKKKKK
jgi:hypothetical protein